MPALSRPGCWASNTPANAAEGTCAPRGASSTAADPSRKVGSRARANSRASMGRPAAFWHHKACRTRPAGIAVPTPYSSVSRFSAALRALAEGFPRTFSSMIAARTSTVLSTSKADRSPSIMVFDWCGPPPVTLTPTLAAFDKLTSLPSHSPKVGILLRSALALSVACSGENASAGFLRCIPLGAVLPARSHTSFVILPMCHEAQSLAMGQNNSEPAGYRRTEVPMASILGSQSVHSHAAVEPR